MKITDIIYVTPNDVTYQEVFLFLVRNGFSPFWMPEKNSFDAFFEHYPDLKLIIIDSKVINDDFSIIQRLKFSPKTADCGIIFISDDEKTCNQAKFLGADYVLVKPFNPEKLLFAIKEVMSKHDFFSIEPNESLSVIHNVNPSLMINFKKIINLTKVYKNIRIYVHEFNDLPKEKEKMVVEQIRAEMNKVISAQVPFKNRFLLIPYTQNDIVLMVFYPDSFSKNLFLELTNDMEKSILPIVNEHRGSYTYGFSDSSFSTDMEHFEITVYSLLKRAYEVIWDTKKDKFSKYINEFGRIISDESIWTEYQPIIDLSDMSIYGYEALSRGPVNTIWQAPEFLFEMAFKFDKIAQLESVCAQSSLKRFDVMDQSSKLFVNIHPLALEELLPSFEDYLSKYPNIELVVEITERKLIQDFKKFKRLFNNMRERGIKIALDDVGSGYSSLQYLVELEIDYMKIDRSLITALHKNFIKESVVNALAEIAKDLGAKVIAEGIEMTTDLEAIKKLDIQLGQGFLFAHPTIHPPKKIEFHG
ncbi:EAL domain-containing response regulator [bacterium]|nr:EAL domain-containing response regulator [bacterium]